MASCHQILLYMLLYVYFASCSFSNFPVQLPVSPFYSISAIWNDHLYILDGNIGVNGSTSMNTYNNGLYSFDLRSLNITYTKTDNIIIKNINNTKWVYTPHQLPKHISEESGFSSPWQSYTQLNNLIYVLAPDVETQNNKQEKYYMLLYDLSIPRWIDSKPNANKPILHNLAACSTNNDSHIFVVGGYDNDHHGNDNDIGYSQIYDIAADVWTRTSYMGHIHVYATGCSYSYSTNNVYSFGGGIYKANQHDHDRQYLTQNTDIILKYDTGQNRWLVLKQSLPHPTINLYCYELSFSKNTNTNSSIYCMHGMKSKFAYGAIMRFNVFTETIAIIDEYELAIYDRKYPVFGFMSCLDVHRSEEYALLYVMGGGIDYANKHYYFGNVEYKLFAQHSSTKMPSNAPSKSPTLSPILPKNYFKTLMGKAVLVLIGLCVLLVIAGFIIYFTSNDSRRAKSMHLFEESQSINHFFNLSNDVNNFSL